MIKCITGSGVVIDASGVLHEIPWDVLRDAAAQSDVELATVYRAILDSARALACEPRHWYEWTDADGYPCAVIAAIDGSTAIPSHAIQTRQADPDEIAHVQRAVVLGSRIRGAL